MLIRLRFVPLSDAERVARLAVYVAARWLLERRDELSLRGAVLLLDCRGASAGPDAISAGRATLDALQRRWPIRLTRVVVFGHSRLVQLAWHGTLRPLASPKLAARVHFCSSSPPPLSDEPAATTASTADTAAFAAELSTLGIDLRTLPRQLGGDSDSAPWAAQVEAAESELQTLRVHKPAAVAKLGARVDPEQRFRVLAVAEDGFAAQLGIQVDDWIVQFNG